MLAPQKTGALPWGCSQAPWLWLVLPGALTCAPCTVCTNAHTASICMCQAVPSMQSRGGGGTGVQLCTGVDFSPLLVGP